MFKRLLVFLFAVGSIAISSLLLFLVFVDIDKTLRPYLESSVRKHLNVEVKIGSIGVSFDGPLRIQVKNFELVDLENRKQIFSVPDSHLDFEFRALFERQLKFTFTADRPEITLVQEKSGALNWSRIMSSGAQSSGDSSDADKRNESSSLYGFLLAGQVRVKDAKVLVFDEATQSKSEHSELNLWIKEISSVGTQALHALLSASVGDSVRLEDAAIDINIPESTSTDMLIGIGAKSLTLASVVMDQPAMKIKISPSLIEVSKWESGLYGGRISGTATAKVAGKRTKASGEAVIHGVDINAAVSEQSPELKGLLAGRLKGQMKFETEGSESAEYKKNLISRGVFELVDGSWSALDGLKTLGQKIESLPGAKERLGNIKIGNKISAAKTKYRWQRGELSLTETQIDLDESNTTLVGNSNITSNQTLNFRGALIVPLNSPPASIRHADGRAKLPFEISGSLKSPAINWQVTTDALTKTYLRQEAQKLIDQVKDQIKDENVKKLLDQAPEGLDKLLKEIKL